MTLLLFVIVKNKAREAHGTRDFSKKTKMVSTIFTSYDFYKLR